MCPGLPVPLRFAPGFWWIARNDAVSDQLFIGIFEQRERQFLQQFIKPGMNVLDVGAHAGFYSLMASKLVGPTGRVVAFEPSPRERQRLTRHLRLNRCRNVTVEAFAVGEHAGEATLLVFDEGETGCNSFHLDNTKGTSPVTVPVRPLDEYVAAKALPRVDLVKMDIEGGELSALRGAERLFQTMRPALICELHEKRTAPWGYGARAIVDLLASWHYGWYIVEEGGTLAPLDPNRTLFLDNGVALPMEHAGIPR